MAITKNRVSSIFWMYLLIISYCLSKVIKKNHFSQLSETIKPISELFHRIEDYVYVALNNCQNPVDDLTQEESPSIYLYTMQFHGRPS
jgi:hypothetical protein